MGKPLSKFPHKVIEDSIQDKIDQPMFVRDSMVESLGVEENDILQITEEDLIMAKKQPLQEIYGQEDDVEVTGEDIGIALHEIIKELKEKYGDDWAKHLSDVKE